MKELIIAAAVLMSVAGKVGAYSWGDAVTDFRPTFTALNSVSVAYAKNLEDGSNAGSLVDHVFTTNNGVLSLNVSLTNTNVSEGTKDVGAIGFGPSVSFLPTIKMVFPEFSDRIVSYVPEAVRPFTSKLYIGYAPSWNLNPGVREPFMHFIVSGLQF